jgi:hypothetical protein
MQENAIYTAVIKKKNIILSEYTDYSGNFEQTIKKIMKNISDKNIENDIYKATIFISKLKIFILKKSEIYLILISDIKEYDEEKNNYAFCFLYSIATKLYELYNPEELKHAKAFTLIDFKKILEQHITNFRSNIKYYKEYLQNISSYTTENSLNKLNLNLNLSIHSISQVHKEHPKEYDPLEIRATTNLRESQMPLTDSLLENNSSNLSNNKKLKCCKCTIISIIIILLLVLSIFSIFKFYLKKI